MTLDDNEPATNPADDSLDSLTEGQRRDVVRARALAGAADSGLAAVAVLLGTGSQDTGRGVRDGFGAARVHIRNLLDVIGELAEEVRVHDQDDGGESYCTACGEWAGMFHGLEGWHHFKGDPSPGGHRTLYDAGHDAVPAMVQPPGRVLSPAGMGVVRQALADASAWRACRTGGDRAADAAQAAAYEVLLRALVTGTEAGL